MVRTRRSCSLRRFPALVPSGSDIDSLSAFYLSIRCLLHLRSEASFARWGRFAAHAGSTMSSGCSASDSLACGRQTRLSIDSRAAIEHRDRAARLQLATLFVDLGENKPLAEHLIVALCNGGCENALILLATLMMKGGRGITANVERGRMLMEAAAKAMNRPEVGEAATRAEVCGSIEFWDLVMVGGIVAAVGTLAFFIVKRIIRKNDRV
jgi:hypothetical protein